MTLNVERRDEDLRRFVGSNSDYFLRKWQKYRNGGSIFGWNWPALFLGAGWLGYRKMYTEAWLIIGAALVCSLLGAFSLGVDSPGLAAVSVLGFLVVLVLVPLLGNYWYFKHASSELAAIRESSGGETDIALGFARKGGVSVGAGFAFAFLYGLSGFGGALPMPDGKGGQIAMLGDAVAEAGMRCTRPEITIEHDMYLVNNESDYGVTVKARIKNEGGQGKGLVKAMLTTSEGSYEREREIYFQAGENALVEFKFAEPTVNASNLQASVYCTAH